MQSSWEQWKEFDCPLLVLWLISSSQESWISFSVWCSWFVTNCTLQGYLQSCSKNIYSGCVSQIPYLKSSSSLHILRFFTRGDVDQFIIRQRKFGEGIFQEYHVDKKNETHNDVKGSGCCMPMQAYKGDLTIQRCSVRCAG